MIYVNNIKHSFVDKHFTFFIRVDVMIDTCLIWIFPNLFFLNTVIFYISLAIIDTNLKIPLPLGVLNVGINTSNTMNNEGINV